MEAVLFPLHRPRGATTSYHWLMHVAPNTLSQTIIIIIIIIIIWLVRCWTLLFL